MGFHTNRYIDSFVMNIDLFKEEWHKLHFGEVELKKSNIKEILTKKSKSSLRGFIFVSIAEFCLFIALNIFYSTDLTESRMYTLFEYFEIANYGVIIFFVLMFIRYLRRIETTSPISTLLYDLLKVRGNMKNYVVYNISVFIFASIYLFINEILYNPSLSSLELDASSKIIITLLFSLFILVLSVVLYFTYLFFYGRFMRNIKDNHKVLSGQLR